MISDARFAHTNLIANDWRKLAEFYREVFGCEPLPPERDYAGPEIDAVTGIPGAHIRGVHLRLPGGGGSGPTLEIFQYDQTTPRGDAGLNTPGFAHIAFAVGDVDAAREEFIAGGGSALGEQVTLEVAGGARVTLIYMRDPEGNIVELQSWSGGGG